MFIIKDEIILSSLFNRSCILEDSLSNMIIRQSVTVHLLCRVAIFLLDTTWMKLLSARIA